MKDDPIVVQLLLYNTSGGTENERDLTGLGGDSTKQDAHQGEFRPRR